MASIGALGFFAHWRALEMPFRLRMHRQQGIQPVAAIDQHPHLTRLYQTSAHRLTLPTAAYVCRLEARVDLWAAGGLRGRLAEFDAVPLPVRIGEPAATRASRQSAVTRNVRGRGINDCPAAAITVTRCDGGFMRRLIRPGSTRHRRARRGGALATASVVWVRRGAG